MKTDERVLARIDELISMAQRVISTRRSPPSNVIGDDRVDGELAHQWATSAQSLLSRVFGEDSSYYKNFTKATDGHISFSPVRRAFGILQAAREDYQKGYLFNLRDLIEAEVFDDFLEQSSVLLQAGYFQAAAVLTGGVLEDGLRKLCKKHGITIADDATIEPMNVQLTKNGIYNKLAQKKITALADIRNKAAHGKWKEFKKTDVEEMIRQVRTFLADYFT